MLFEHHCVGERRVYRCNWTQRSATRPPHNIANGNVDGTYGAVEKCISIIKLEYYTSSIDVAIDVARHLPPDI